MTHAARLVDDVIAALDRLAVLGETVEDERIYVRDVALVWTARLRAVAAEITGRAAHEERAAKVTAPDDELDTAVRGLIAEVDRITDPHRAIDWMSTLPQATLVALGEVAW